MSQNHQWIKINFDYHFPEIYSGKFKKKTYNVSIIGKWKHSFKGIKTIYC